MTFLMVDFSNNYDFYASKVFSYLPLCILGVIVIILFLPNSKRKFLRIQASLPTSKIKSLAKGLVEVQEKLIMITPLISPVRKEKCIGYHYTIEDVEKDQDGRTSYTTIHSETKCNIFEIEDETGIIKVDPEGIEFILLKKTTVNSNSRKRYSEILLKENQEMLLVGYADTKENTTFIRRDDYHNILGITSALGISIWNKYQPLLRSFLFTCIIILSLITLILLQ